MEVGFSFPESLTFPKSISVSLLNRLPYLCLKTLHCRNWIFILQAVAFHNASVLLHDLIYLFDPYFDGDARGTIAVANLEVFPQTQTWYLLRYITWHKGNQIFNVGSDSLCCDRQCVWTKNDYWIYHVVNCFELYRKKYVLIDLIFQKKKTYQWSFTANSKIQNCWQKKSYSKHSCLVSLQQSKWSVLSSDNASTTLITDVRIEWRCYHEIEEYFGKIWRFNQNIDTSKFRMNALRTINFQRSFLNKKTVSALSRNTAIKARRLNGKLA